jgi:hypothetical protein
MTLSPRSERSAGSSRWTQLSFHFAASPPMSLTPPVQISMSPDIPAACSLRDITACSPTFWPDLIAPMTVPILTPCLPLWATTTPPSRTSIGPDAAAAAMVLGRRFIPWQHHLADLAGTLTPAGRFRYRRVVAIVPRRAGKTFVILAYALAVARRRAMARTFYASHRRETAAAMWRDDWFPRLEQSKLYPRYIGIRRSNGSEAITWRHNRSIIRILPPDGDAMRSFASDLAFVDEAREFSLLQGEDFEAAAFPTQATGHGGQFWIVSNAGDMSAAWLRKWRDIGRASVDDPDSQVCYVEYGAPDGADLDDETLWPAWHPGLGYHVDLDALRADRESMPPDRFAAEYLGVWPEAMVDNTLVDAFAATVDPAAALVSPIVLGLELSIDRDRFVIVAAGTDPAGRGCVLEVLEDRPHGPWVVGRVGQLAREHRVAAVVWDAAGPVGALAPDLLDLAANCLPQQTRAVTSGAGALYDATLAGLVWHRGDPVLIEACRKARRRGALGAWLWDRREASALPWLAGSLARWTWSDQNRAAPTIS